MRYLLCGWLLLFINFKGECQTYLPSSSIYEIGALGDSIIVLEENCIWYASDKSSISPEDIFDGSNIPFHIYSSDSCSNYAKINDQQEFWVKFSIKHNSDHDQNLILRAGWHDRMELYQKERNSSNYKVKKAGLTWNYFDNSLKNRRLAFEVNLEKGKTYDFVLRFHPSLVYGNFCFHPLISSRTKFDEIYGKDLLRQRRVYSFAKGALAILFFFFFVNLGQYFLIRDKSYLYYSFYLLSFFFYLDLKFNLYLFPYSDFILFYFFDGNWVFGIAAVCLFFAYSSYAIFVRQFLNLKNTTNQIGKYFDFMIKIFLAFTAISFAIELFPNNNSSPFSELWIGMLISAMILGSGALYHLYKEKQNLSKFIFWGTLFFTIGVSLGFLVSIGLVKIPRTEYPLLSIPFFYTATGILIEAIFFSIGLAYRTKSVELEKQLLAKEKEYEIAKTKLYTNITHEFRTPLTIIRGNANLILKNPRSKLEERVEGIRHYADTLKLLVDDLLDLSKLQAGREQISMNNGDIIEYVEYIVESFQSLAFSKRLSLSFHSEVEKLNMDFSKKGIQQVITNLIGNAIKFTPEYGSIKVEVKNKSRKQLQLKVIDNGVGIPKSELKEIFKPFHRVESQSTFEKIGTGLGLSIVKQLIENMDGTVEVKSMLNAGTTFFVTLNIKNETSPYSSSLIQSKSKQQTKNFESKFTQNPSLGLLPKVLVVEDNKDVNQYIQDLLIGSFTVFNATNGQIGFEKAIEIQPDIIISDEMMPIMSGFEMIEKLKTEPATRNIPVIMLTARSSRKEELRGLKLKVEAYLTKPLDEEKLLILLENLLEKAKAIETDTAIYWDNKPMTDEFMKATIEILEEQFSKADFKAFNLKYLLQKKGYGAERKTERAIKEHFSTTTAKLILAFRLEKARTLLIAKPELSIPEIIDNVGLECDQSYFTRIYKEKFKITPGDERK